MSQETTWLTPDAHDKLQLELDELKTKGRAAIEERIAEARSHGDIRENADYDAAKNDQGLMEARIRQLENLLDTAEVGEVSHDGTVRVGSVVTVVDDDGDEMAYFVATHENKVATHESKLERVTLATPTGPLGQALMGARVGDTVSYQAPGGMFAVQITGIEPYQA